MYETRCIKQVIDSGWHSHQCRHKRGFGPGGQWCKQHDPERQKAELEKKMKALDEKYNQEEERRLRTKAALALLDGIPTEEIKNYKLVKIER